MNHWHYAGLGLMLAAALCLVAAMRGGRFHRLVAAQLGTTLSIFAIFAFGEGFGRSFLQDLAVAMAALSLPGSLAFVRWLGRVP